jgi:hypothetical protein
MWGGSFSDERMGLSFTMLLVLASAVILGFESRGTRNHVSLPQIGDLLFTASYDSQGHGGGIRPRLHKELINCTRSYSENIVIAAAGTT